jgi:PadR family transcriptional regulator, regulatory protein PadR
MYKSAMNERRSNPPFTNGVPEMLLLHLLAREPMYGYQLVQAIREASGQTLEFGEGCIYPILHRLEAEGLVSSRRQTAAGRSRVVYRTTAAGSRQLRGSIDNWERIVAAVRQVLGGAEHNRLLGGDEHGRPALAT